MILQSSPSDDQQEININGELTLGTPRGTDGFF